MRLIRRFFPQIAAILFWVGMMTAIFMYLDAQGLTLSELIERTENTLTDHWYGTAIFLVVIGVLRPFTLIPTVILVALGGRVFGVGWGFIYGMIGTTFSALIPYYAGKLFATAINENEEVGVFRRPSQRIARFMRRNAFESLVTLRLIQGPYDLVSFVAGNIHMPVRMFTLGTLVGNLAPVYAFAALGASVEVDWTAGSYHVDGDLVLSSVVVFVVSLLAARWIKTRKQDNSTSKTQMQTQSGTTSSQQITA